MGPKLGFGPFAKSLKVRAPTMRWPRLMSGCWRILQSGSYKLSRLSGDVSPAQRGVLGKRPLRREVTQGLDGYNRLWR